ncbi:MAG: SPOR domain-containing protein [Proteobacteria bacterium]|jgi:cell division protein FtsN|nr:SPOR domain-containing protein [Pseudomonadota bacterium]
MAVERYVSKTDVVVKLVLVFFIALLSFSIGTFVGKKFSDNQHKLAEFEPTQSQEGTAVAEENHADHGNSAEREIASISPDSMEVKPGEALTDDEIAKLAEEFVTDDVESVSPNPAPGHGPQHEAPAHHSEKPKKETVKVEPAKAETAKAEGKTSEPQQEASSAAQRLAQNELPSKEIEKDQGPRLPASLPTEVAGSALGKFTVQVGSYNNEKEAQSLAADLKSKGFSAFYVTADVKGQKWYRVSVGLFTTQKEATAYRNDLLARKKFASAIVQKVTSEK